MNDSADIRDAPVTTAVRLLIRGRVQGVGMRPAIARLAGRLSVNGFARNTPAGLEVHVEGSVAQLQQFCQQLPRSVPELADVHSIDKSVADVMEVTRFELPASEAEKQSEPAAGDPDHATMVLALVPPDLAVCQHCIDDLRTPENARHHYPFTSCTNCGPRYSIITAMPYERYQTSMQAFVMCSACRREYECPSDRRFHAQTIACPRCGPRIWLADRDGRQIAERTEAIDVAARLLARGKTLGLRGLGGYQLLTNARDQSAVARLRQRKGRRGKPLAVMVRDQKMAQSVAQCSPAELAALASPAGPVLIVKLLDDASLAPAVTQGLPSIGILLPTTPLHWLLLRRANCPLVCTSGNWEGEPLAYAHTDAASRLTHVADAWLEHDRPIERPIDDSVVRFMAGRPVTIRLARGVAPFPLDLQTNEPMVALGGHQKAALAISNGAQAVLGPHIGDLDSLPNRERFVEQLDALAALYNVQTLAQDGRLTARLVTDLHPDYYSNTLANAWAENRAKHIVGVQHHHAHIAAVMLEQGWLGRTVIGVALDGTGYGMDGTVWGGEFLVTDGDNVRRVGHLRPFPLAGGDIAAREPWRVATALVAAAVGPDAAAALTFRSGDALSLAPVLARPKLAPQCTSAGRLFDGIAALILGWEQSRYEGEAAVRLEAECERHLSAASCPSCDDVGRHTHRNRRTTSSIRGSGSAYRISIEDRQPAQLDWRPLVQNVLRDRAQGTATSCMAMRFHLALAQAIVQFCDRYPNLPVAIGGGVFQNRVLVELLAGHWTSVGREVAFPGQIPPNDGGLAAGQLAVATCRGNNRG